jgi:hypothetical protein
MFQLEPYMRPWQLPLWLAVVAVWLVACTMLLRWGLGRAGLEKRKNTFLLALKANVLSTSAGIFGGGVVAYLVISVVGASVKSLSVAVAVSAVLLAALSVLVVWAMLNLSFGKAAKVTLPPVALLLATAAACGAIAFNPVRAERLEQGGILACGKNMRSLRAAMDSVPAASLREVLPPVPDGEDMTICPRTHKPYFYNPMPMPAGSVTLTGTRLKSPPVIVACDVAGNHADGLRWVITSDGACRNWEKQEFQDLLAQPQNVRVAKELAEFEAKLK